MYRLASLPVSVSFQTNLLIIAAHAIDFRIPEWLTKPEKKTTCVPVVLWPKLNFDLQWIAAHNPLRPELTNPFTLVARRWDLWWPPV